MLEVGSLLLHYYTRLMLNEFRKSFRQQLTVEMSNKYRGSFYQSIIDSKNLSIAVDNNCFRTLLINIKGWKELLK